MRAGVVSVVLCVASCGRVRFDDLPAGDAEPPCTPAVSVRSIDAGHDVTCAQLADDSLLCWGANEIGELGNSTYTSDGAGVAPTGLSAVTAYSVGFQHSCAIRGGDIYCWGRNDIGQLGVGDRNARLLPTRVAGLPSTMVGVAAGGLSTCAWTSGGALYCWGGLTGTAVGASNTPVVVPGIPPVRAAALSSSNFRFSTDSGCVLGTDDTTWCWGANSNYQLADGTNTDRVTPVRAAAGLTFRAIAAGDAHVCGATASGDVYCWGRNVDGQGAAAPTTSLMQPTRVDITDVVELAANGENTCARVGNGDVLCWGDNDAQQLGRTGTDASTPERMSVPASATIAVGTDHGCALGTDGVLRCWGPDRVGAASAVTSIPDTVELDATNNTTCVRTGAGAIYCWGAGAQAQLGDAMLGRAASSDPIAIVLPRPATDLAVGYAHSCARLDDGSVYCWGWNESGQINGPGGIAFPPTQVSIGAPASSVGAGGGHSCATTATEPWCWGHNSEGALGFGTALDYAPTQTTFPVLSSIVAGRHHTCGITPAGDLYCAGRNNESQIGNGGGGDVFTPFSPLTQVTSVATGDRFTCASRMATAETYCWGEGIAGQLGVNRNPATMTPTLVPALPAIAQLTAGYRHTCALDTGGVVRCWGSNANGQLGDGTQTSTSAPVIAVDLAGATQIEAGARHTCALRADGSVRCVGGNDSGQLGGGSPVIGPAPRQAAVTCPAL